MEEVVAGKAHNWVTLGDFACADYAGSILLSESEVFFHWDIINLVIFESFHLFLADPALHIVVSYDLGRKRNMFVFGHLSGILVNVVDPFWYNKLFPQRLFLSLKNPPFWPNCLTLFLMILDNRLIFLPFYSILSKAILLLLANK